MAEESADDIQERIKPLLTAVDTYRTVVVAGKADTEWSRSARDNLMRELGLFQTTEATKRIAELEGLLRDVLEHLDDGSRFAQQVRDALGVVTLPPPSS